MAINQMSQAPPAEQKGSKVLIGTGDNRLQDAVYRDGTIWAAASDACMPPGDSQIRACARFIELTAAGKEQDFDLGQAGAYYFDPAVEIVPDPSPIVGGNDLIAAFNRSSAKEHVSVVASGRRERQDPPNTLRIPVLVKAGEASYLVSATNGVDRNWGDYSGAGFDPLR
ncbi:MAG: hypothetical protein E6H04_09060 [Bacillati bacterium ANGP1]|uniref:Uncharacterized protein n=1 Tax=Candidatus Segetimicrobium genomatis TaxID=2569760 RepID=A0A537J9H3_9BACT|nr:MAG: hypothetical protein E6H04_09060 [Terrabacteria group bacterium ANGP1]